MKLNKKIKLLIACDGGAASGKTTAAKLISKKYNLHFLSSGLLYRYIAYKLFSKNKNGPILRHSLDGSSRFTGNARIEVARGRSTVVTPLCAVLCILLCPVTWPSVLITSLIHRGQLLSHYA